MKDADLWSGWVVFPTRMYLMTLPDEITLERAKAEEERAKRAWQASGDSVDAARVHSTLMWEAYCAAARRAMAIEERSAMKGTP